MEVKVELAAEVQIATYLYPPLVVGTRATNKYDFVSVMLIDEDGNILEDSLQGTLSMSGMTAERESDLDPTVEYAVFSDLVINYPGTFYLIIHTGKVDYGAAAGPEFVVMEEITTGSITASDGPVNYVEPTEDEKKILRALRHHGGFPVPKRPFHTRR